LAQGFERSPLRKTGHLAVELQSVLLKCLLQVNQKQPSEAAPQYWHGEKERLFLASNPTIPIGADASTGNDAMQMRMQVEVLSPRVQYRQETDRCAQTFAIGGDPKQRFRSRAEQDAVDLTRILERKPADLLRQ